MPLLSSNPPVLRASGPLLATDAWERYARPALWSTWAPHLASVDCDDARIRVGTVGVVRAVGGLRARFRVDAVDEAARTWSWTVRSGPVRMRLEHAVVAARSTATGASGSSTTLVLHGPRMLALAYAPLALRALQRLVA